MPHVTVNLDGEHFFSRFGLLRECRHNNEPVLLTRSDFPSTLLTMHKLGLCSCLHT